MLIKFFKSSFLSQYLFIALAIVILWIPAFRQHNFLSSREDPSPLFGIFRATGQLSGIFTGITLLGCITILTFLVNKIFTRNDLLPLSSTLSSFIFIVIVSSVAAFQVLSPVMMASVLLLFLLDSLLKIIDEEEPYERVFNAGFVISLASMFYLPAIFFVALLFITLLIARISAWREWFIAIAGMITPYLFLAAYYYWTDTLFQKILEYSAFFSHFKLLPLHFSWLQWIILILILVLTVRSMYHILSRLNVKTINTRKKWTVLVWFLLTAIPGFLYAGEWENQHLLLLALPLSAFQSSFLSDIKKTLVPDLLLILLMLMILLNNYGWSI